MYTPTTRRVPDPDVRENGIFDDLYWSVSPIQICMLHGCQLSDKCPHCFVKQPYISTSVEPGYCHNCRKFLGSSNTKSIELDELQAQIRQFQFFYLVTFDKLRPDPSMLRRNLEALKACHPMGESGSLALLMGVSEDVVRNWMNGKRKPKLATLFQLQSALGLAGIYQLFYPETVFLRRVLVQRNYGLRFDARPEHKSLELESQIGDVIHTMLVGINQTMSRKELANKFGVTMGYLQYRFGSQLRQLSRQHLERLAEDKTKCDSDARVLIDRAVSQVISRNKSTTIENVMADVPRGRRELVEALSETEMNLLILKARHRRNHIQDTPDLNLSEDDDF